MGLVLLIYGWSSCETGLNERRLLVEGSEVCDTIPLNSRLVASMAILLVPCKVTLYRLSIVIIIIINECFKHARLDVVWHIPTRIFIIWLFFCNVVSVALISSYEILCPKRFNQRMILTESVFHFTVRPSWTCFGILFFTNACIVNKVLERELKNFRILSVFLLLLVSIESNNFSVKKGT